MKKIIAVIAAFALILSLAACGSKGGEETPSAEMNVSVDELAGKIIEKVSFTEQLESLEDEAAYYNYGIEGITPEVSAWASSSAVVDCLAVFKAENDADVQTVQAAIESTVDYLRDGYSDYGPDQVPKLDSAVTVTKGNYVVFCVAADNAAAAEAINSLLSTY